ncbi:MAG TPA: PilZ domain-containing protein [Solirubrobacteraceae bacterium]|nr:PilZ domain-containing protein [Solirubrobacteraceae bacterium]
MSFIPPAVGRPVRVLAGEASPLADVLAVADERIELVAREPVPAGRAELLYSTPRGVVVLAGELSASGTEAVFVPHEQQRADQRREAFRVPVRVDGELRRASGEASPIVTVDLSPTGVLLRGAPALEPAERVTVTLQLDDAAVELPAVVRRHETEERYAVSFEEPPRSAVTALERFLAAEQRKLL